MLLPDLLNALADLTATERRPDAQATAQALCIAADTEFPARPSFALSPGILHTATVPGHPAARLIHDAHRWLPWQDGPAASLQPDDLSAIKSVVTLLGPGAPIPSEPSSSASSTRPPTPPTPSTPTTRPIPARSSGNALWQARDRRFPLAAGQAVHHPPNLPHAMRAGPEGFLAMWRWSGDIAVHSYRMLPDPEA